MDTALRSLLYVSEIHENVDLVMGMKNVFELEGVIESCESCFSFPKQVYSIFLQRKNSHPTKKPKQ